jgi:hypothetical protein
MGPNPFLELEEEQTPKQKVNPFLAPIADPEPSKTEALRKHDEQYPPERKTRPDGSYYSSDARERMKQLQEDGKMTPAAGFLAAPAKRKKAKRAAEVLAEMASEEAEKIKQVFMDGIDAHQPMSIRLQAAKQILEVEGKEEELAMQREKQEFEQMSHSELRTNVVDMLERLNRAGMIANEVLGSTESDDIPDAQVVDD